MKTPRKLAAAVLTLASVGCVTAPRQQEAPSPPPTTELQREFDAVLIESARDPRNSPVMTANARATRVEFDSLGLLDARYGTHEAQIFFDQERERAQRILDAMIATNAKVAASAKD